MRVFDDVDLRLVVLREDGLGRQRVFLADLFLQIGGEIAGEEPLVLLLGGFVLERDLEARAQHGLGLEHVLAAAGPRTCRESKNFGSGQKRTVVPVLRWPTVPTTSSFEETLPSLKLMLYSLPLRLIQHSSCFDSAFTTDTPTPCRPPETS